MNIWDGAHRLSLQNAPAPLSVQNFPTIYSRYAGPPPAPVQAPFDLWSEPEGLPLMEMDGSSPWGDGGGVPVPYGQDPGMLSAMLGGAVGGPNPWGGAALEGSHPRSPESAFPGSGGDGTNPWG